MVNEKIGEEKNSKMQITIIYLSFSFGCEVVKDCNFQTLVHYQLLYCMRTEKL